MIKLLQLYDAFILKYSCKYIKFEILILKNCKKPIHFYIGSLILIFESRQESVLTFYYWNMRLFSSKVFLNM